MSTLSLKQALEESENIILVAEGCNECKEAKELLSCKKIPVKELNECVYSKLSEEARTKYHCKKYPIVFLNKQYVGGLNELKAYLEHK